MIELYQAESCPFCQRVRNKLTQLGVSYVIHNPRTAGGDVRNAYVQSEMETLGGQDQIPFLVDTARGETLYESEEIVTYLEAHYA